MVMKKVEVNIVFDVDVDEGEAVMDKVADDLLEKLPSNAALSFRVVPAEEVSE